MIQSALLHTLTGIVYISVLACVVSFSLSPILESSIYKNSQSALIYISLELHKPPEAPQKIPGAEVFGSL